eukprot:5516160-Prymnesium_polylepis.1
MRNGDPEATNGGKRRSFDLTEALNVRYDPTPIKTTPAEIDPTGSYDEAAGLTSKQLNHHESEESRNQKPPKLDLR